MSINPYKRLREVTGINQKDFAAKYDLSRTAMTYIESGQVADLSERMIVSLGQECHERGLDAGQILRDEYGVATLSEAYQNWKSTQRMANAHRFQVPLTNDGTLSISPFQTFIEDTAATQQMFCKLLKVPAAPVLLYAKGETLTMPKVIEDALEQVRYPRIPELKDAQDAWNAR